MLHHTTRPNRNGGGMNGQPMHNGGPDCCTPNEPLISRRWHLEQLASGLQLMDLVGLHPDDGLAATLTSLAHALQVELSPQIPLRHAVAHAAQCAAALPDTLLSDNIPPPPPPPHQQPSPIRQLQPPQPPPMPPMPPMPPPPQMQQHQPPMPPQPPQVGMMGSMPPLGTTPSPPAMRPPVLVEQTQTPLTPTTEAPLPPSVVVADVTDASAEEEAGPPAITLHVRSVHCEGCSGALQSTLGKVLGVRKVSVTVDNHDTAEGTAKVWVSDLCPAAQLHALTAALIDASNKSGKPAEVVDPSTIMSAPAVEADMPARMLAAVGGGVSTKEASATAPEGAPLGSDEREELTYLRKRVAELEAAISGLAGLAGK